MPLPSIESSGPAFPPEAVQGSDLAGRVKSCSCRDGTFACGISPAYDIGGAGGSRGSAGAAGVGGSGGADTLCRDDAGLSCTCTDGGSGCSTESTGGTGSAGTAGSSTDAGE
jgi:hypothetical protein